MFKQIGDVFKIIDINDAIDVESSGHSMVLISAEHGLYFGRFDTDRSKIVITS